MLPLWGTRRLLCTWWHPTAPRNTLQMSWQRWHRLHSPSCRQEPIQTCKTAKAGKYWEKKTLLPVSQGCGDQRQPAKNLFRSVSKVQLILEAGVHLPSLGLVGSTQSGKLCRLNGALSWPIKCSPATESWGELIVLEHMAHS